MSQTSNEGLGPSRCYDAIEALEAWKHKERCRWVQIEIDDCYGATCWRVQLHRGAKAVYCSETNFFASEGVDPTWHEKDGNLYCCVVDGDSMDDWPGLAATIKKAIDCADRFFKS